MRGDDTPRGKPRGTGVMRHEGWTSHAAELRGMGGKAGDGRGGAPRSKTAGHSGNKGC